MASFVRERRRKRGFLSKLFEPHRRVITLHCYRMLGSLQDAEEIVQMTRFAFPKLFPLFGLPWHLPE